MADSSRAFSVSELEIDRLAAACEYRALAVLGASDASDSRDALQELAASSNSMDAFRWLWDVQRSRGHSNWFDLVDDMPEGVVVPSELRQDVRLFILEGSGAESDGRAALLTELVAEFSLPLARAIAEEEDLLNDSHIVNSALEVLGASAQSDDQTVFFIVVDDLSPQAQIEALAHITSRKQAGEQDRAVAILGNAIPALATQGTGLDVEAISRAMLRYSAKSQVEVLSAVPIQGGFQQQVVTSLAKYKPDVIDRLLDRAIEPALATTICVGAVQVVPAPSLAPILIKHHAGYPSSCFTTGRTKLMQSIDAGGHDRESLIADYWRIVGAATDSTPADEIATIARASELGIAASLDIDETRWHSIGRAAGLLVERDQETYRDGFDDIAKALTPHPSAHAAFIVGFTEAAVSHESLPIDVARHFTMSLEDVRSLAGEDRLGAIVAGAQAVSEIDSTCRAAVDAFHIAADELDSDDVAVLRRIVSWSEAGEYNRFVDSIAPNEVLVAAEIQSALLSLPGKEADRIPTPQLVHLLGSALDHGFADAPVDGDALGRLLLHPNEEIVQLACRWIECSRDASEQTVSLVIRANHDTSGQVEALRELRRSLGVRLIEKAKDPSEETADRVSALGLAVEAHRDLARSTAFELATSEDKDLRVAAARALADTPPRDGDDVLLAELVADERVHEVSTHLELALRRISTSSIDEAIFQLLQLLEIDDPDAASLDPGVLLPDDGWHEGFMNDVNELRLASQTPDKPRGFINVACSLADTIAEQAVVVRGGIDKGATTLSPDQLDAIRDNKPNKQDIGSVLRVQLHQGTFPWFNSLIALREFRAAHTAPSGGKKPLDLTDRHFRKAVSYLEDVTLGWVKSMYEAADLAAKTT
jgi:hypothetical protein